MMIPALYQALTALPAPDPGDALHIEADRSTPWATLRRVMYTAGQARFGDIDLVVEGPTGEPTVLRSEFPPISSDGTVTPMMGVKIGSAGYRMHGTVSAAIKEELRCPVPCAAYNTALLDQTAEAMRSQSDSEWVMLVPEPQIPLAVIVETADALRGTPERPGLSRLVLAGAPVK
jgi:hypothetical protein